MAVRSDNEHMARVLELASKGKGKVSPNPLVGTVVVRSDKVIGEGSHAGPGKAHAEILALRKAGTQAKGGSLYVNLEPCCHTGRTGPCTEAIIAAGITRVVYAIKDPDPRVNGRGVRALKKAGVETVGRVLEKQAAHLNEFYLTSRQLNRPFVILKTAQTLDGTIATHSGDSKWISSDQSLKFGHALRAEVDAVLVGGGTARTDDPALTVRRVKGRNPYRIVLSSTLDLPNKSQLISGNDEGRTILASTKTAIDLFSASHSGGQPTFWEIPLVRGHLLNLQTFLEEAHAFGLTSILIEGGSKLATSFMNERLVDKYICLISPKLIGAGIPSLGNLNRDRMADAITFKNITYTSSGPDMIFTGYPDWSI